MNNSIPYQIQSQEQSPQKQKYNQKHKQLNKKKLPKIIINVSDTQYAVVKSVAKKFKWIQISQHFSNMNFDLCWTDNHVKQDVYFKMHQYQKINHFPGMDILSRKNNLGKSLMAFKDKFPEDYDFFPQTWMLPNDWNTLKEYNDSRQAGKSQTFIVKPQASCQGRGIFLTRNIEKLKGQKCVVQRYLNKPLLIDQLKFDMRIYVLVAGIDPLRIFVFQEGLARFATEKYVGTRSQNLQNKFMHLTNYAINKNSPNFVFNQNIEESDKGHKRSLTSVMKTLKLLGYNIEQLQNRIDDIIIKTIITGYPTISKIQQSLHPENYANDMCFEILGLDVMLDHRLKPILLEINYTPSFTADTPLDKQIKSQLISDSLTLLGINEQWKHKNKLKRQAQIKQRMMTGKRKYYTLDEKIQAVQYFAKQRDRYEMNHLGSFRKIFVKSQEQFYQYRKYYEYAEQLYTMKNRLIGINQSHVSQNYFNLPFIRESITVKNKKEKREKSVSQLDKFQEKIDKKNKSIDPRRISSAKSMTKKIIISTKNTKQKINSIQNIYFDEQQTDNFFHNQNLKNALKKKPKKISKSKKQ